ncbi:hypothetical protein HII31_00942 [Pseudocercospora fuligena]|uniref:Uncharacterized protein n=1 Tax=Pseudocercospora fuligena TaxID=685502 RepID=A0A8H6RUY9_9PEZI|nr:hypothetical protein HII31_00942 [Pseudocercospora fuligena]
MPTFKAAGVTATLFSCELSNSIADPFLPSAKETARVAAALRGGRKLDENPIGSDGSTRGVLRYIGEDEDMPFMMVEAGDKLKRDQPPESLPNLDSSLSSIDSPLTSLGPTPTASPANAQHYLGHSHAHPAPSIEPVSLPAFYRAFSSKQALRLAVKTLPNAHIYTGKEKPKAVEIDIKIEVFFNGDLANSEFINTKRVSMSNERYFHGTRIDTQAEKPWVYDASAHSSIAAAPANPPSTPGIRPNAPEGGKVNSRWKQISASLTKEAFARGDTPTATYLNALAAVPIPQRLEENEQLGVIDVLVTTGKGYKYAPKKGYINRPTRMDNEKSKTRKPAVANEGDVAQMPPRKKTKLDHVPVQPIQPQDITMSSDPVAELAQERADMVIDQGGDPGGHLMGTISRLSPHKPPQVRQGSSNSTITAPSQKEDSVEPEIETKEQSNGGTFVVPDSCRGSAVTYDANPACQRQVSKVRPGFFEENQVVVGMRFVVL